MDDIDALDHEGSGSGEDDDPSDDRNGSKHPQPQHRDEGPACHTCRKKKAKCSRQQPCSHCHKNKLVCVYDDKKGKPGLKTGAIDRLNRRVDELESMFLGQGVLWQQVWRCLEAINDQNAHNSPTSSTVFQCTQQLRYSLTSLGGKRNREDDAAPTASATTKKSRRENANDSAVLSCLQGNENTLLSADLVDALVEIYFSRVHPWIPILHVHQFRSQMAVPQERKHLKTILNAIVSVCVRFSDDVRLGGLEDKARLAKANRQTVILQSMESFSVENLQAMIICAFDTIGNGRGPSAWSIVGSMARTVEQLQLSIEEEDQSPSLRDTRVLVKRMAFLRPCKSWIELEERRRVFWNVFLMDRFCSIATGWNVCLTSADVKRRLPCEGALWEEGNPLCTPTPYFGVSDPPGNSPGILPSAREETADQVSLGGFAYCIEATESLSLVTSFFLQQAVDVSKAHDVQLWLMRFKQLDLRLVQWKIFLPERWREACALNDDGNMDPNLTLAHITHNTAVVLLHQGIAYPSPEWQSMPIKLPSASSAETCLAAAVEVAIIAEEFLRNTTLLTNPQFAFCLFVCGRMLVAHSFYYDTLLPDGFESLVNSLWEMSNRWNGVHSAATTADNLASKFARRLIQARQLPPNTLDILQVAYSEDQAMSSLNTQTGTLDGVSKTGNQGDKTSQLPSISDGQTYGIDQGATPDSITLAFPPLPLAFQAQPSSTNQTAVPSPAVGQLQLAANGYTNQLSNSSTAPESVSLEESSRIGFDDLSSFLDYPFLPNHRVSVFSHPNV